jgi:pimeloyl-ACP methyl ester carboxylesterase
MNHVRQVLVLLVLVLVCVTSAPAHAATPVRVSGASLAATPTPGPCVDGTLPGGALSRMCIPSAGWNGSLVVYAHGYVAPDAPLAIPSLQLLDGTDMADAVQRRGYAFATTSYHQNGLAVLAGVADMRELIAAFPAVAHATPLHTYVVGISEGGLVSTLLVERYPSLVSGGIAACGPIADFQQQLDYVADARVLFDYFFPAILPGSPIAIPDTVRDNWDATYVPAIRQALANNPHAAAQLLKTAHIAVDDAVASTTAYSIISVLWYNVFATDDATLKLGGNPYGNMARVYSGSDDDTTLNAHVARFTADATALANVGEYRTSGELTVPLVTMHTTGDQIVPFAQASMYAAKQHATTTGRFVLLPVSRYGHCNFTTGEVLSAFDQLTSQRSYLPLVMP